MKSALMRFIVLWLVSSGIAQAQVVEIRATGEHRIADETPEVAVQFAAVEARRNALDEAAIRLRDTTEIKAVPLKGNPLDAFLSAILNVETDPKVAPPSNAAIYRVEAYVSFSPAELARRLDKLRKDPAAVRGLVDAWERSEEAYLRRAELMTPPDISYFVTRLNMNDLVARAYAALARTEESPASARVSSVKGRQRAFQLAQMAVMLGRDQLETHLVMGDALLEVNQVAAAEEEYRQGVLLNSSSSDAHVRLADALRVEGRLPEAIVELREALRLDPRSVVAHTDLGFLLAAQQPSAEAISEDQEALRLDADFVDAHNNLAVAYARQGKFPDAVAEFQEIVRIDPDSALGYFNMALALADMEKDRESAEALRQVVRINPTHFNARYNLGELFRLEGKFDEMVKQFREYLRLVPDIPERQRNIRRARELVEMYANP